MHLLGFLDFFTTWWDSLNGARQLFYGIGLVAGAVALILGFLAFIGMEHHDVTDAASVTDLDHGGGGIFSIKPLTGFFLGFGWAGGMAVDAGLPLPIAVAIALAAGVALTALIVLMFRTIYAMRSDGTMRVKDALGATGTVYVTVPPDKAAGGQVVVTFAGRQETFSALNAAAQPLASGRKVKVTAIIDGQTVQVEPL